jgi:hypothetical protein
VTWDLDIFRLFSLQHASVILVHQPLRISQFYNKGHPSTLNNIMLNAKKKIMRLSLILSCLLGYSKAGVEQVESSVTHVYLCEGSSRQQSKAPATPDKKKGKLLKIMGGVGIAATGAILGGLATAGVSSFRGKKSNKEETETAAPVPSAAYCQPYYYC